MNKIYILLISTLIIYGTAYAQRTESEVKAELDIVNEQLITLRQTNMHSPEMRQIQEQLKAASDDYAKAVDAIPGVKEIDSKLEKLREQMLQLQKEKMDLIRKKETSVQSIKNNRESISERLRDIMLGGEQGKALMEQQRNLMKKISEIKNAEVVRKTELGTKASY